MYYVICFSFWASTLYFPCFPFFVVDRTWKYVHSSLFCKRSIIGQLNIPAATAENEERHTYSKMIYTGFQNSYSFCEVFFDKQLFLKGRKFNWKLLVVELIDWGPATSPKRYSFKYFEICNFPIFFDTVGTSFSQNGF